VVGGLFGGTAPGLFSDSRRTASGNGAIPGTTSAFAPTGAGTAPSSSAEAAPLRLQGAIQPGAATATSLRPSAAAGIKPPARPQAKPLLTKPASPKVEPAKPRPAQAAAKPQPAKPAAKTKINKPKPNDDA
jgi:D-alanyl-D-alanine carboxypeptidase